MTRTLLALVIENLFYQWVALISVYFLFLTTHVLPSFSFDLVSYMDGFPFPPGKAIALGVPNSEESVSATIELSKERVS